MAKDTKLKAFQNKLIVPKEKVTSKMAHVKAAAEIA